LAVTDDPADLSGVYLSCGDEGRGPQEESAERQKTKHEREGNRDVSTMFVSVL
jgi:hypothetical protein